MAPVLTFLSPQFCFSSNCLKSSRSPWIAAACKRRSRPSSLSLPAHIRSRKLSRWKMQNETTQDASDPESKPKSSTPETSEAVVDDLLKTIKTTPKDSDSSPSKPQYSMRARLREETEAPFRKARMFAYGGSAISAGVGAFVAALRIIAALAGVSGTQPLHETVPNVAINLGVVGICALLLRLEVKAGNRRLERMSRGARIGGLRIEDSATRQVLQLKELRGRTRVVLVAGSGKRVSESMAAAEKLKKDLSRSNLLIVPFIADSSADSESTTRFWRMQPYIREVWRKWYEGERGILKARSGAQSGDVLIVIVRLDGKVGARSVGAPMWTRLIEEVRKLPNRDQYGKP